MFPTVALVGIPLTGTDRNNLFPGAFVVVFTFLIGSLPIIEVLPKTEKSKNATTAKILVMFFMYYFFWVGY